MGRSHRRNMESAFTTICEGLLRELCRIGTHQDMVRRQLRIRREQYCSPNCPTDEMRRGMIRHRSVQGLAQECHPERLKIVFKSAKRRALTKSATGTRLMVCMENALTI